MNTFTREQVVAVFMMACLVLTAVCTVADTEPAEKTKNVTVFAAAGTMSAIQQVAVLYERQTGCEVITNYASSSTLAKQIQAGADFDVYVSANSKWMDFVEEKKLIQTNTRGDLMGDRLALIARVAQLTDTKSLKNVLLNTNGSISIGDPSHVPAGAYAKEALEALGCWTALRDRMIPAPSVRAAQRLVETGECSLGIVYRAGALQSGKVKVLGLFDETLYTPIRFSVAAAAGSNIGRQMRQFLDTPAARDIYDKSGFSTSSKPASVASKQDYPSTSMSAFGVNEWQALMISVKVAATCVLAVAAPGILLGYLLAGTSFPGRSVVNALIHLPLVIPPVVTGYLGLLLLGKHSVVGGFLDRTFGISFAFNFAGAVLVAAVMGFPLLVRSVKTAVEMVDNRYRYAAHTLGAGPVRTFLTITLPLAGPGILAGLVLAFARSLGEFGATAVFIGNIPGKTQTLSLAIYNFMQIPGAEASAARLVMISVVISFAAIFGSELLLKKMHSFSRVRS